MGMKSYQFVGAKGPVWLPDDIDVIIDIVPSSRTNIRSNQKFTGQKYSTYHETANYNAGANATAERNWLHSGAGGAYVGYNFAVDDKRLYQLTPLDEVTWAAGVAWWNQNAWAVEQCVGKGVNIAKARDNATWLHAGLLTAIGVNVEDGLIPHQRVYGKWCPALILNAGAWPDVLKTATRYQAVIRAHVAGKDTGDAADDAVKGWPYPDPVAPPFWGTLMKDGTAYVKDGETIWYRINTLYRVKAGTSRLQYAVKGGKEIGPKLAAGAEFRATAIGVSGMDGRTYVITPMLTRVALDDLEYVEEEQNAA